jgi:hypothetical protein
MTTNRNKQRKQETITGNSGMEENFKPFNISSVQYAEQSVTSTKSYNTKKLKCAL